MRIKKIFIFGFITGTGLLTACSRSKEVKNVDNSSEILIDAGLTESTETFQGLEKKDMDLGNKSDVLVTNGRSYKSDDKSFYVNASGELIAETNTGSSKIYEGFVFGCLNYYKDRLYFIEKDSHKVFSMLEDGTDLKSEIEEEIYYLLVCEDGMVYVDKKNNLYQKKENGEIKLLEEATAIWENIYGEWIIYVNFSDENHPVIACNLKTGEKNKILDYGFFPIVYEDELFFQGKDTFIYRLNLSNGEIEEMAEVWGQNFVKIEDRLYFCGGNKIQYVNLTDSSVTSVCNLKKNDVIQEMWEQNGKLYFYETAGQKSYYKIYDEETGKVIDYE